MNNNVFYNIAKKAIELKTLSEEFAKEMLASYQAVGFIDSVEMVELMGVLNVTYHPELVEEIPVA